MSEFFIDVICSCNFFNLKSIVLYVKTDDSATITSSLTLVHKSEWLSELNK
jgi:hypothetical protein